MMEERSPSGAGPATSGNNDKVSDSGLTGVFPASFNTIKTTLKDSHLIF